MGSADEGSDDERTAIRKELSHMTFEELMKLKEQLGTKKYDEAMFGASSSRSRNLDHNRTFKRANKNRPREMSSKIKVAPILDAGLPKQKKTQTRDPRFDSLCGEFKEKVFRKAYGFVEDIKVQEKQQLKEELKSETDGKRKAEIKYLIQRMENQERELKNRKAKEEKEDVERRERVEMLKRGEKPTFLSKSERKTKELVEKFEELKKSGKISKHIEKHRKKKINQDRKKFKILK
ncbi:ribosomal RNA processing protein 36 homolog [Neocloeon triangulifer]|uniref:ribosomal RNA processing protein 36 homolog n=1 Tax=Neocloeon triangulifer TaxID=2078957 RepID=UPI00286F408A|nr:ribosomal RNA processing protein 36 homolog [Neocloeon triangulifer]